MEADEFMFNILELLGFDAIRKTKVDIETLTE